MTNPLTLLTNLTLLTFTGAGIPLFLYANI